MKTLDISNKVVYQIYPKSFKDSNGDGWGDLRGVTQKLDYLAELGVDYIWLTPFFPSPQRDNGYDVADYRAVDPRYGTMADFEELACEAGIDGMMTVGEMSSTTLDACLGYTRPEDHELSMAFSFHHLKVDYKNGNKWELMPADLGELRRILSTWQEGMQAGGGWNALFWDNHDQPRVVSRFGSDGELRVPSAKMLCLFMNLLRGTPYIYQGNELGMTNAHFTSIDEYRDVESINYYRILTEEEGKKPAEALRIIAERSRDNARTPMQWDSGKNAGFTTGEPWSAPARDAEGCDQRAICAAADGPQEYGHAGSLLVVANFSPEEASAGEQARQLAASGEWEVLLSSHGGEPDLAHLRPYEGAALLRK